MEGSKKETRYLLSSFILKSPECPKALPLMVWITSSKSQFFRDLHSSSMKYGCWMRNLYSSFQNQHFVTTCQSVMNKLSSEKQPKIHFIVVLLFPEKKLHIIYLSVLN